MVRLCTAVTSSFQNVVEVLSVIRVEEEVQAAYSGDNIKLKLKGLDDEVF